MSFVIKRNDTSPAIQYTLVYGDGTNVNLTGATVRFHMATLREVLVVDEAAVLVDGANGVVKYNWAPGDTSKEGTFRAEFEATYSDGTIETFPNRGWISVSIDPDLG